MSVSDRYTDWVFYVCLFLTAVFVAAGGLGVAAAVAVMGAALLPVIWRDGVTLVRRRPPTLLLFCGLIGWICLSLAWSAYPRPDQALKLVLLTPLFLIPVLTAGLMTAAQRDAVADWLALVLLLCGVYFTLEAGTRGSIGAFIELRFEGAESLDQAKAYALRTLSRGATAFIMLAGPTIIWLWSQGLPRARYAAIVLGLMTGFAAASFGVESNIIALVLGCGLAALALREPVLTLQGICAATAIWLLGAPLFMSAVVTLIPDTMAESLPLSWHWRLEIWRYALEQIREAPMVGHGLDAARTMNEVAILRGVEIDRLPLHAHNAGLHIWLETGAVGAALAAAVLLSAARAVEYLDLTVHQAASLAFVAAVWLTSVTIGYGIWQEWHHAALALSAAVALLSRP